jgi:hypothetical protein
MEKSSFIDFSQIFENEKTKNPLSWIVPPSFIFLKTVCYKILVLLGTTKRGRVF